jgi:cobalt transporter subunit CbtA
MFRKIVFSAAVSGLVVGVLISLIQSFTVIPMILQAETYEVATTAQHGGGHDHSAGHHHGAGHQHDGSAAAWTPKDGAERFLFTMVTNTLAAIGFALLLAASYSLLDRIDWRKGVIWGLCGFAVFQLAPAVGLPPELPGTAAADITARQLWWVGTAAATAAGLALLAFATPTPAKIVGALVILVPHLIGAPQPEWHQALAPQELATRFLVMTMVLGATFWLLLGGLTGFTFNKFR